MKETHRCWGRRGCPCCRRGPTSSSPPPGSGRRSPSSSAGASCRYRAFNRADAGVHDADRPDKAKAGAPGIVPGPHDEIDLRRPVLREIVQRKVRQPQRRVAVPVEPVPPDELRPATKFETQQRGRAATSKNIRATALAGAGAAASQGSSPHATRSPTHASHHHS